MSSGYHLYEHRSDPSVLIVARPLDPATYECRRYGAGAEGGAFALDSETFLSIYRRRRSDRV